MIISWLFLPTAGYSIPGLPDYTKTSATTVGTLLGVVLFDFSRLMRFRPKWYDIPMLVWCLSNFFTSLSNDLTAYDGISTSLTAFLLWGLPYLLGRIYLSDLEGLTDLAYGIVLGALAYVPLCLWESRMSPTIYQYCYGVNRYYEPGRFGFGFRPIVFLATGLEVGVWMGAGTLCSYAFWRTGAIQHLKGFQFRWVALAILFTTILTKSVGAIILALIGVAFIEIVRKTKLSLILWVLILTPVTYMTLRTTGLWDGQSLINLTEQFIPDRKSSIETRIVNENLLVEKALQRPFFGWGGWNRSFVSDKQGKYITIADGYWVIVLGLQGLVGLTAMSLSFLLPQILFLRRVPGRLWRMPEYAGAVALCLQVGLFMIDSLSNAMPNPSYALALGGLTGLTTTVGLGMARREGIRRLAEAEAYKASGELEAAEASYRAAIDAYASSGSEFGEPTEALTESAYAFEALADLYSMAATHSSDAELCLTHAIEIHESLAAAHHYDGFERLAVDLEHLARLQHDQGRHAEVLQNWMRALDIRQALAAQNPSQPLLTKRWAESLNDLAWMLASRPESASHAVELAVKAVDLDPTRAGFWNTLGFASYYAGDYVNAEVAIERALEYGSGGTGFDYYLLAMIGAQLGKIDQAEQSFRQADDWTRTHAPNHPVLARLRIRAAALLNV